MGSHYTKPAVQSGWSVVPALTQPASQLSDIEGTLLSWVRFEQDRQASQAAPRPGYRKNQPVGPNPTTRLGLKCTLSELVIGKQTPF